MAKKWIPTPEILRDIEQMAASGLNEQDIAWNIGIDPGTLTRKKHDFEQIEQSISRGRAQGVRRVTSALVEQAEAGNTQAAVFYLKNRRPDQWNDIQAVSQIQVNLGRLSDSQLLDELRKDPQMLNAAGLEIEQQIEN